MAFDDYTLNATLATAVENSFNDTEENTLTVDVGVADSFNETDTTTDSHNTDVGITDSFHEDSYNTDIELDHSGNTDSYNDSFEYTDNSTNDNSINAGVRSYNLGFSGDVSFGAAAAGGAGGGDVMVNNENTVVDQSVNGNIAAFGPVYQGAANEAVTASGDDSLAAGDDIDVYTEVDQSTSIDAHGDVLIDSTKTETWSINSGNQYDFSYSEEDNSIDVDVDDSFNSYTHEVDVTNSFNDEELVFDYTDVDIDVDAIIDSSVGAGDHLAS